MTYIQLQIQKISKMSKFLRVSIRFIFESLVFFTIYLVSMHWIIPIDFIQITANEFALIQIFLWVVNYKLLRLNQDSIRFSSLKSFVPLVKLTSVTIVQILIQIQIGLISSKAFYVIIFGIILFNALLAGRIFARQFIRNINKDNKRNILIYGTDQIATDLVNALSFSKRFRAIGFINDKLNNKSKILAGLKVFSLNDVSKIVKKYNIKLVVFASNKLSSEETRAILQKFDAMDLSVTYAPTVDQAFDYEVQLKSMNPEDVLGREVIYDQDPGLYRELNGATVLVTGAGGSIGSEICKQLLRHNLKKIIMLDISEFALYELEKYLNEAVTANNKNIDFKYYLGSILDEDFLQNVFEDNEVDIVYHAAAYKHVPIIEDNVIAGIKNNVFGTQTLASIAADYEIKKFILVSTDKAVRPTNIMGATKRLAELICKVVFASRKTTFSLVRFGNVLGSSGSVIPLFKSQIKSGGPVTVTHPDITRFFMSIPEAAALVLKAGNLAIGGEVFLLDMGEPIKIVDLAKSMIRQHGLRPVVRRDLETENGNEILISFTGLRPGEKLYEELLIDADSAESTTHPKIYKALEPVEFKKEIIEQWISELEKLVTAKNPAAIKSYMAELQLGYVAQNFEPQPVNDNMIGRRKHEELIYDKPDDVNEQSSSIRKFLNYCFIRALHVYFWLVRGMTLGVRVAIFNEAQQVLLVKHTYINGWYLPGGGVDRGETLHQAARREVREETGISNLVFVSGPVLHLNARVSRKDHIAFFQCTTSSPLAFEPSAEIAEARFFDIDKLPSDLESGSRMRIMECIGINNGVTKDDLKWDNALV